MGRRRLTDEERAARKKASTERFIAWARGNAARFSAERKRPAAELSREPRCFDCGYVAKNLRRFQIHRETCQADRPVAFLDPVGHITNSRLRTFIMRLCECE